MIFKKSLEFWFLFFTVVGYLISSAIAIPLGIEDGRVFSYSYRAMIFFASFVILVKEFRIEKIKNYPVLLFLVFWIFYLTKFYYSLHNHFYESTIDSYNDKYIRILMIVLVPSLALMLLDYTKIDFQKLSKYFFWLLLVVLFFNLLYGIFHFNGNFRLSFIFNIYYISYGHYGTSLALISLYFLLFSNTKSIYFIGLLLGLLTIFLSTARSPILAFAVVSFFFVLMKKRRKFLIIYFILFVLSIIGIYVYGRRGYVDFQFLNRTYNWLFLGDNSLRTPLFQKAIKYFRNNVLIGDRVFFENGFYPHNIFLELLMATGILGLVLYFLKFLPVLLNMNLFLNLENNKYYTLMFSLFLQYFVLVNTSYSLIAVSEFLYLSAIIIGISLNYSYEKIKSNDGSRYSSRNY
ncbi:O-antigen ligase family protein [Riemerella anatipestifer]|uniref:O-antigen ligase family protein n=1 Tax=Riemerella anatipestifer TaxID=34085 RepID=UPI00129E4079|nr:O-antigen ligase family protein [Riemerella anatipestifer]